MPLLEAKNVSRTFPGTRAPSLTDVNLSFEPRESVGIVGESGSGKTTLARILLGLDAPSTGTVLYQGATVPTSGKPWRRTRRELQLIPQHASGALNPRVSIHAHFSEVIRAHHLAPSRAAADELITTRLQEVHLEPRHVHAYPRRLSGGQQQRAVIARSLLLEPTILICDEPTSALDALIAEEIMDLLEERCITDTRLFMIITHDLRVAAQLCDRILVMHQGHIIEDNSSEQILNHPQHTYTQELLDAAGVTSPATAPMPTTAPSTQKEPA